MTHTFDILLNATPYINILVLFFLVLITFFLWSKVVTRFTKNNLIIKSVSAFLAILSSSLLYLGTILIFVISLYYYPRHDFTKEKWIENPEKRYEIVNSLIKKEILIGKTKDEVRDILEISDAGSIKDLENYQKDTWTYGTGVPPMKYDYYFLEIIFREGKAYKIEHLQG